MANISDILNRPAEDVEAPKPLPAGSYNAVIRGMPEQGVTTKTKTVYLRYSFQITGIREDVSEDDVTEFESSKSGPKTPIIGRIVTNDYYIQNADGSESGALFMLTNMLEAAGIDFTGGKSIGVAVDESPNCELVIFIFHEPTQDGKRFRAKIGSVAQMDEAT